MVDSSQSFLARHRHSRIPPHHIIATVDAKDLYPSIEHEDLLDIIDSIAKLMQFSAVAKELGLAKIGLATLIVELHRDVLRCQVAVFDGVLWRLLKGIATGLACGVKLANLYLVPLDKAGVEAFPQLIWYARYVDDVCICLPAHLLDTFVSFMNSWRPSSITWECTTAGRENIAFLVLSLTVCRQQPEFETFRKA